MKTSERTRLCLVPIPVLFFVIASIFLSGRGPFYCAYYYDPDYNYLFNALNLSLGYRPEHVDHPSGVVSEFAEYVADSNLFGTAVYNGLDCFEENEKPPGRHFNPAWAAISRQQFLGMDAI